MLVTFRSDWGNITMFGDVAITLLKMSGHSGTVPSALLAADIPAALDRLKQALVTVSAGEKDVDRPPADADDPDAPPPIGLALRAHPFIELLSAAARQGCDVMWDEGS